MDENGVTDIVISSSGATFLRNKLYLTKFAGGDCNILRGHSVLSGYLSSYSSSKSQSHWYRQF